MIKQARKAFFSEEKKQKTFMLRPRPTTCELRWKQKFFGSFFQKRTCLLFIVVAAFPAQAQKPPPRHAQVGAGDIFAALTQPDHPAELDALHALQDALSGSPDPAKLEAARAKLAEILQAEERHQTGMPPALVMSGIASRIESAMAALEEARHAPPPPPDRLQTLVLPGLAALSAALGVALIACLAGLATRGRQAEEQEELQDTLKKIRRRLEGTPPAAVTGAFAQNLAEAASGEASEAVHQATVAVDRLGSAARDAEGRLQTSVNDAEARLHAAAAMAGQLEQWMEALPDRLSASLQAIEAQGLPDIEAATARMAEGAERLAALPDVLADYAGAVSGLTAHAEQATADLQGQVSAMDDRFEALAAALPELVSAALPATLGELNNAADLLAEMGSLALGQSEKLQDIIARADKVAYDLPAAAQALETVSAHLLAQADQDARSAAGSSKLAEHLGEISQLTRAAAEALPEQLAAAAGAVQAQLENQTGAVSALLGERLVSAAEALDARLATGADRMEARLQAQAASVGETLAGQIATAAESIGARFAGRAELLQAGLEQAALAVTNAAASLPAIRDGLGAVAAQLASEASAQIAAHREAAPSQAAETASTAMLEGLAQNLVALTSQLQTTLDSAEALRAQAAEHAESAQADTSDQVATLFEVLAARAEACLSALPSEAAALAATAAQLRGDAAELAASAMRMDTDAATQNQLPAQTGVVLGALQSVCQRLEEALAGFGATGMALNDGVARIGRETQRLQDGSEFAQATLAASSAALQDAGAMLIQTVARVQAAEPTHATDPAMRDMQVQLADLTGRLGLLLEELGEKAAHLSQSPAAGPALQPLLDTLSAQADGLATLLGQSDTLHAQSERLAAVLDRNEHLSQRLAEAAHAVAAAAEKPPHLPDSVAPAPPDLTSLQAATETVQRAAARLLESVHAQDAALARAHQAAAEVARLAPAAADGTALAGLNGLASLAESLQGEAETLAACVLRGDTVRVPPELIAQTPIMLAAIETSIHRLRGTATALALASDGRLKAA
jgi:hypothetical protein